MKALKTLILVLTGTVLAAASGRAQTVADFPHRTQADGLTIGARLLDQDEVKNRFFSDVYRKYVVLEVALEPSAGSVSVSRSQFSLLPAGADEAIPAATPAEAAKALREDAKSAKSVTVTLRSDVGYRTGDSRPPYQRNDPLEDPRDQRKGFYSRTGVDVTWGGDGAGSTLEDERVMATELADKEVPLGGVGQAVSGYLYFAKPDGKTQEFELRYESSTGEVRLALTP